MINLYETNSHVLVIANGDEAWSLTLAGDHMHGMFVEDATGWLTEGWQPSEIDGLHRADIDEHVSLAATWSPEDGLQFITRPRELGKAARDYIGEAANQD